MRKSSGSKRDVILLEEQIANERKLKTNTKQYRYHIVLEVSKIYKAVALREETSQNTPYLSHVLRLNSNHMTRRTPREHNRPIVRPAPKQEPALVPIGFRLEYV